MSDELISFNEAKAPERHDVQYFEIMGAPTALFAGAVVGALALTGCQHLGPKTVAVDRFDYGTAINEQFDFFR